MRLGKYEKIRLQLGDFFQIHLGPVLRGIHDGNAASATNGVGEKRMLAGGNHRLRPNDKKDAHRGPAAKALLEIGEAALHFVNDRGSSIRDAEELSQYSSVRHDVRDGMRVGGV